MAEYTLLDVAKNNRSQIKAGIMANIVETSPVFTTIPVVTTNSMRYSFIREGALPASQFRNINSPFAADNKGEFITGDIDLKIQGDSLEFDAMIQDEATHDGLNQVTKQMSMKSRAMGLDAKNALINSNTNSQTNSVIGIKEWVDRHGGTVNTNANDRIVPFAGAAAGINVATAALSDIAQSFDDLIDKNVGLGMTTHLYCSRELLAALNARFKNDTANDIASISFQYETVSMPGPLGPMSVRIGSWNGMPMIPMDFNSQEAAVIGDDGASKDGTAPGGGSQFQSMYAVVAREGAFCMLQKYADGARVRTKPSDIGTKYYMEFPYNFLAEHPKSVARMMGIGLPA